MDRGFSFNGQIVIASIFLYGDGDGKSVEDILEICQIEWDKNWNFQHPDLRGDPDAPGKAGIKNRISLEDIYEKLGILSPVKRVKVQPIETKRSCDCGYRPTADTANDSQWDEDD
jgi:hypothetical protein